MNGVWLGVSLAIGAMIVFVAWRYFATNLASRRRTVAILGPIVPVIEALQDGRDQTSEIQELAERPATRAMLYRVLEAEGFGGLFPKELAEPARIAESDLVFWLIHPNELAAPPDEIEVVQTRNETIEGKSLRFFLFKFRTHPPHWCAERGWLAGIAGPYAPTGGDAGFPPAVFSRFEAFESRSTEEHFEKHLESVASGLKFKIGMPTAAEDENVRS